MSPFFHGSSLNIFWARYSTLGSESTNEEKTPCWISGNYLDQRSSTKERYCIERAVASNRASSENFYQFLNIFNCTFVIMSQIR